MKLFLALMIMFSATAAMARDNGQWDSVDPVVREWYRNLKQPDVPAASCCDLADAYWADEIHVNEKGETVATITDDRDDAPLGRPHVPLHELFEYDPVTGSLINRTTQYRRVAGTVVGTPNNHGHLGCRIDNCYYYVHRIIWKLVYGVEPPDIIDHKNGIPTDNRIENLRAATYQENNQNNRVTTYARSGLKGVYWHKKLQKWRTMIMIDGKLTHLGCFETKEEAYEVYLKASLNFYGEFSPFSSDT